MSLENMDRYRIGAAINTFLLTHGRLPEKAEEFKTIQNQVLCETKRKNMTVTRMSMFIRLYENYQLEINRVLSKPDEPKQVKQSEEEFEPSKLNVVQPTDGFFRTSDFNILAPFTARQTVYIRNLVKEEATKVVYELLGGENPTQPQVSCVETVQVLNVTASEPDTSTEQETPNENTWVYEPYKKESQTPAVVDKPQEETKQFQVLIYGMKNSQKVFVDKAIQGKVNIKYIDGYNAASHQNYDDFKLVILTKFCSHSIQDTMLSLIDRKKTILLYVPYGTTCIVRKINDFFKLNLEV